MSPQPRRITAWSRPSQQAPAVERSRAPCALWMLTIVWLAGLFPTNALLAQPAQKKAPAAKAAEPAKKEEAKGEPAKADADAETTEPETPAEEETAELIPLDKMELPSFRRLIEGPPVDWIVLLNQKVLEVEPLYPRPGTIDDVNQRIKQSQRKPGTPAETDADRRKRLALYNLPVTLLEGEDRDFKLHIKHIKDIIYYEDLMLRRIDKLLDERQVRQAYELLVALDERQADWPGVNPRRERLLLSEALVLYDAGRDEQALALLESLHARNASYAGLDEQLGKVTDRLISTAHAAKDFRQSRFFLKRLAKRISGHKVVTAWTNRLTQETRDLVQKAIAEERNGHPQAALDLAEEAARTWPELPELLPVFNRLTNRYQRLRVGVVELPPPGATTPVVPTPAERRRRQLTETSFFQPAQLTDKIVRYETRFFQDWEPADLGHSVVFRLQPFRLRGESQPPLTAAGLAEALSERVDAASPRFDARFAAAVAGMNVRGPFELAVQFRQVPLRPEGLFAFPYRQPLADGPAAAAAENSLPPANSGAQRTYPFELQEIRDNRRALYTRSVAEPESSADRHIAEIIEIRYDSHEKAIQGLLRGEVSLLPETPAAALKGLSNRNEFTTLPYGIPVTHVLQFHPNSKALQSRALRRGLIYALDRPRLLQEVFLQEPPGNLGRVVSAPWASTIYAYNPFIVPHKFDGALAYSLAKTAEKELAQPLPTLRFWTPDDPQVRAAAARIVEAWGRAGVKATLISAATGAAPPSVDSADWDVAYRVEVVSEPLVELWPLLALTPSTETETLGKLPTWLRHELLALDRVGDWRSAERILHKLHRQLWAEVHLIPLWELDDHFVVRKNIRNIPDRPLRAYQAIERWKVEPWFSRD